ncbi:MAG: GtrA family protein [Erysipelotrichaceae bacterium]
MTPSNKLISIGQQFFKFGLVGVLNTLIGLATYYLLVYLNIHYLIANAAGFMLSVINAYYFNSKYVFKVSQAKKGQSFIKSLVSYGSTFLISTLFLFIMVHQLGISDKIAPLINLCFTIPANYLLHKLWVF